MQKGHGGFTLIELVVVIVILGILAAAALPRFVDLTDDAEEAAAEGLKGSLASGVNMVRSKAMAQGKSGGSYQSVTIDGTSVAINDSGWPYRDSTNLLDALIQERPEGWSVNQESTKDGKGIYYKDPWKIEYDPNNGSVSITES